MNIKYGIFIATLSFTCFANSADFNNMFKYVGELVSPDNSMSDKEKVEIAQKAFGVTEKWCKKSFCMVIFLIIIDRIRKQNNRSLTTSKNMNGLVVI